MKLVAAAKVRRAQEAVINSRPFTESLVKVGRGCCTRWAAHGGSGRPRLSQGQQQQHAAGEGESCQSFASASGWLGRHRLPDLLAASGGEIAPMASWLDGNMSGGGAAGCVASLDPANWQRDQPGSGAWAHARQRSRQWL